MNSYILKYLFVSRLLFIFKCVDCCRRYYRKILRQICQTLERLKDLEKVMSNKDAAAKYGASNNIL